MKTEKLTIFLFFLLCSNKCEAVFVNDGCGGRLRGAAATAGPIAGGIRVVAVHRRLGYIHALKGQFHARHISKQEK